MAKWRLTDGNDLYESVDLVLLPAGFRTVTVQSSVVQNDGLLITYFDRERLTTAIVGISGTLSSSENNVLLPYVFFCFQMIKFGMSKLCFKCGASNCVHLNS